MIYFDTLKKRIGLVLIFTLFFCTTSFCAEGINLLRIGTGGKTGVYYPIGKIIAQGISDASISITQKSTPYFCVAQNSGGSIENAQGIISGDIEAGLVQADVASQTFKATNTKNIRAIASLYPEKFQIVVRPDANIKNIYDLRGKRISIDEKGSGTLAVMRIVLETHGLSEKNLKPVYLKPVFTHDKIVKGELQGFVMMAGAPMEAVSQLLNKGVSLVPISPEMTVLISRRYPYLVPGNIDTDIYPGIPKTHTIQVHALLCVNKKMDDELASKITAALWSEHTQSLLKAGPPQGKAITPGTALSGISIPLHPGAKKYYQNHIKKFNRSQPK